MCIGDFVLVIWNSVEIRVNAWARCSLALDAAVASDSFLAFALFDQSIEIVSLVRRHILT